MIFKVIIDNYEIIVLNILKMICNIIIYFNMFKWESFINKCNGNVL